MTFIRIIVGSYPECCKCAVSRRASGEGHQSDVVGFERERLPQTWLVREYTFEETRSCSLLGRSCEPHMPERGRILNE